jgi:hypothetical protein
MARACVVEPTLSNMRTRLHTRSAILDGLGGESAGAASVTWTTWSPPRDRVAPPSGEAGEGLQLAVISAGRTSGQWMLSARPIVAARLAGLHALALRTFSDRPLTRLVIAGTGDLTRSVVALLGHHAPKSEFVFFDADPRRSADVTHWASELGLVARDAKGDSAIAVAHSQALVVCEGIDWADTMAMTETVCPERFAFLLTEASLPPAHFFVRLGVSLAIDDEAAYSSLRDSDLRAYPAPSYSLAEALRSRGHKWPIEGRVVFLAAGSGRLDTLLAAHVAKCAARLGKGVELPKSPSDAL